MDVSISKVLTENGIVNKSLFMVFYLLLGLFNLSSCSDSEENTVYNKRVYSEQDWEVFDGCKARVYRDVNNIYDYLACSEMLKHKKALKKYGASHSYSYWINRLYKNSE